MQNELVKQNKKLINVGPGKLINIIFAIQKPVKQKKTQNYNKTFPNYVHFTLYAGEHVFGRGVSRNLPIKILKARNIISYASKGIL